MNTGSFFEPMDNKAHVKQAQHSYYQKFVILSFANLAAVCFFAK